MFRTESKPAELASDSFHNSVIQFGQESSDNFACKTLLIFEGNQLQLKSTLTDRQHRRDLEFANGTIDEETYICETRTALKDLRILSEALSRETKALKLFFAPKMGSRPQQINHVATQTACWFESNGNQRQANEISNSIRRDNAERVEYYEKLNRENAEFYANLQREREKFYEKINREREEYIEKHLIEREQRYISYPFTRDETLQPRIIKSKVNNRLSAQARDPPVPPYQIVRNILSGQPWKRFFKRTSKKGK